jgi:hypothetical protein
MKPSRRKQAPGRIKTPASEIRGSASLRRKKRSKGIEEKKRTLFLVKGLDERLVVLELKVLESTAHEVHCSLGKVRLEAGDLRETVEESSGSRLQLLHRVEVERLGRVGEDSGEGALHRRVGSLDAERPFAESTANLTEDLKRVVDDDPAETPSGSEPALRDSADSEAGGGAANSGVRGEDAAVELALDTGSLDGSGTGDVPGETGVDWSERREESGRSRRRKK